ncbi:MAG: hypothetical protein GY717_15875 [Rhodobacteraceae bacterium]|nr:hypothetical protein [Paracoccaceae bacterium]
MLDIVFGNVTSWSDKASQFLLNDAATCFLAVETHLAEECVGRVLRQARQWGWAASAAPAVRSLQSDRGTYGGVLAAVRASAANAPLEDDSFEGVGWVSAHSQLAGRQVALQGADLLVLAAYCRHGIDFDVLGAVSSLTKNGALPFILVADFNAPPSELSATAWPDAVGASVVVPDAEATCLAAARGSMLDYVVVSDTVRPYLTWARADWAVPWAPHSAVRLRLRRQAKSVKVWRPVRPCRLPRPLDDIDASTGGLEELSRRAWNGSMDTPFEAELSRGSIARSARGVAAQLGTMQAAQENGVHLLRWARAAESFALYRAGRDPADGGSRRFLGRCTPLRFKRVQLMPVRRGTAAGCIVPMTLNKTARSLATITAAATRLVRAAAQAEPQGRRMAAAADALVATVAHDSFMSGEMASVLGWTEVVRLALDTAWAVLALEPRLKAGALLWRSRRLEELAAAQVRAARSGGWASWVHEALRGGASAAHRFTNAENKKACPIAPLGSALSIQTVAEDEAASWRERWMAGDGVAVAAALACAKRLREAALETGFDAGYWAARFGVTQIREACARFPRRTAIGPGFLTFRELAALPDAALRELGRIMERVVSSLALPIQELAALIVLLGKKGGGRRAIALCPTFYRLLLAILGHDLRVWDRQYAHEFDTSAPGCHAELQVAKRALLLEVARTNAAVTAQVLWDVHAFFDSVRMEPLAREVERLRLPAPVVALALQLHRALRVLSVGSTFASHISATACSIVAGGSSSTTLARALLWEVTGRVSRVPGVETHQHVDDLSQTAAGASCWLLARTSWTGCGTCAWRFLRNLWWLPPIGVLPRKSQAPSRGAAFL